MIVLLLFYREVKQVQGCTAASPAMPKAAQLGRGRAGIAGPQGISSPARLAAVENCSSVAFLATLSGVNMDPSPRSWVVAAE